MTPAERLKEIEIHFKNMNNFGWPEDVQWLIARVKRLTEALVVVNKYDNEIPKDYIKSILESD